MPWDSNTHIMTAPVGLGDISQAVHYSSLDLGTLITEGLINKWALYKPFVYSSWGWAFDKNQSTPALRQPGRETPMRSKNTGLAMRRYGSSDAAWTAGIALVDGGTDWKHIVPSGYYRALDFDGYNELAGAPFQYGPMPNPAYKLDTVKINDASGATTSEIEMTDLMGDDTMVDSNYGYFNIRSYNIYAMLGKRNGSTPASVPSLIYSVDSTVLSNLLSEGTWDCVTIFTNKTFTNGSYRADNGIFVLAPVGRRSFVYHEDFGFNGDVTATRQVFKINVFHNFDYATLGVLFCRGGIWDSAVTSLETSPGELRVGTTYTSTRVIVPQNCNLFRMYVNGSADTKTFAPQITPAD